MSCASFPIKSDEDDDASREAQGLELLLICLSVQLPVVWIHDQCMDEGDDDDGGRRRKDFRWKPEALRGSFRALSGLQGLRNGPL